MTGRLDGMTRPGTVGEQRPVRRGRERSVRPGAPCDDDGVAVARSSLRRQQVVPGPAAIEVRRLGPDPAGAPPDHARRAGERRRAGRQIQLGLIDERMVLIRPGTVAGEVDAILEEGERRVDPFGVQPGRLRPRTARMLRRDDEVAAADVRGHEVVGAVVVPKRRRVDAARAALAAEVELAAPRERVTDLAPSDQVAAVEDRHAREVLEAAAGEVEVAADPADRRIGMHPGQDRVVEQAQPLTAPESPPTIRFSATMKKSSAGTIDSAVKAKMPAESALCSRVVRDPERERPVVRIVEHEQTAGCSCSSS